MTGRITPDNLRPHPKNPTIANFFKQLGWVEELGSGIRKMYKYCPIYISGALPVIEEGDVFRLTIRYENEQVASDYAGTIKSVRYADNILNLIRGNPQITIRAMAQALSVSERTIERALATLTKNNHIQRRGSNKVGEWIIINPSELSE